MKSKRMKHKKNMQDRNSKVKKNNEKKDVVNLKSLADDLTKKKDVVELKNLSDGLYKNSFNMEEVRENNRHKIISKLLDYLLKLLTFVIVITFLMIVAIVISEIWFNISIGDKLKTLEANVKTIISLLTSGSEVVVPILTLVLGYVFGKEKV